MSTPVAGERLVREVAELLRQIVDEDAAWLDAITPDTLVDGELLVESHELAAWSVALRERYGDRIDLVGHVAGLDIDGIIALTVGEVAALAAAAAAVGAAAMPAAEAQGATEAAAAAVAVPDAAAAAVAEAVAAALAGGVGSVRGSGAGRGGAEGA